MGPILLLRVVFLAHDSLANRSSRGHLARTTENALCDDFVLVSSTQPTPFQCRSNTSTSSCFVRFPNMKLVCNAFEGNARLIKL
ncbi:hypothetical protein BDN70DRAFT_870362 [Pholiota conissans]|uniref:Secreted protein n=1 Tax=Pholiota conissans TaxID=109636 RepID=A0A9P5ZH15_9AGAR|nr:hypothetical protein BDN70DRAFT_870362 [Pholiota conissans]